MSLEALVISLVVIGFFFLIAQGRSGADLVSKKPSNLKSFVADSAFEHVMKAIIRYGQQSTYNLNTFDEENGFIVLSESASATHWGFLYPIYLERDNGKTIVEVGIRAKIGFVTHSSNHEKCFNQIKAAVFAADPLLPPDSFSQLSQSVSTLSNATNLIRLGRNREAWNVLNDILTNDPKNENAWLMAFSLSRLDSRRRIFEKASLHITNSPVLDKMRAEILEIKR